MDRLDRMERMRNRVLHSRSPSVTSDHNDRHKDTSLEVLGIMKLIKKEGRTARNVVNWSVQALNSPPTHADVDEQDEHDGFTKVSRTKNKERTKPTKIGTKTGKNIKPNTKSKQVKVKKTNSEQPSPRRRQEEPKTKMELHARYWNYLISNVIRAIDEIYESCELDQSPLQCEEVISILQIAEDDFRELISRFKLHSEFEKAVDHGSKPQSLAWSVRKISPMHSHPVSTSKSNSPFHSVSTPNNTAADIKQKQKQKQSNLRPSQQLEKQKKSSQKDPIIKEARVLCFDDQKNDDELSDITKQPPKTLSYADRVRKGFPVVKAIPPPPSSSRTRRKKAKPQDHTTTTTNHNNTAVNNNNNNDTNNTNTTDVINNNDTSNTDDDDKDDEVADGTILRRSARSHRHHDTDSIANIKLTEEEEEHEYDSDVEDDDFDTNVELMISSSSSPTHMGMERADDEDDNGVVHHRSSSPFRWGDATTDGESQTEDSMLESISPLLVCASPGSSVLLHQKLSSPSRKRSISEYTRISREKQVRALKARELTLQQRSARLQSETRDKVNAAKGRRDDKHQRISQVVTSKMQRAEELRVFHLKEIQKKAQEEEAKINEIAFINKLEEENKKMEVIDKLNESQERLNEIEGERHRKAMTKAAKQDAAALRREAMEAERVAKVQEQESKRQARDEEALATKRRATEEREKAAAVRQQKLKRVEDIERGKAQHQHQHVQHQHQQQHVPAEAARRKWPPVKHRRPDFKEKDDTPCVASMSTTTITTPATTTTPTTPTTTPTTPNAHKSNTLSTTTASPTTPPPLPPPPTTATTTKITIANVSQTGVNSPPTTTTTTNHNKNHNRGNKTNGKHKKKQPTKSKSHNPTTSSVSSSSVLPSPTSSSSTTTTTLTSTSKASGETQPKRNNLLIMCEAEPLPKLDKSVKNRLKRIRLRLEAIPLEEIVAGVGVGVGFTPTQKLLQHIKERVETATTTTTTTTTTTATATATAATTTATAPATTATVVVMVGEKDKGENLSKAARQEALKLECVKTGKEFEKHLLTLQKQLHERGSKVTASQRVHVCHVVGSSLADLSKQQQQFEALPPRAIRVACEVMLHAVEPNSKEAPLYARALVPQGLILECIELLSKCLVGCCVDEQHRQATAVLALLVARAVGSVFNDADVLKCFDRKNPEQITDDVLLYAGGASVVDAMKSFFMRVSGTVIESEVATANIVENCLLVLSALTRTEEGGKRKKAAHLIFLEKLLRTEAAGTVHLLYSMLLHPDQPRQATKDMKLSPAALRIVRLGLQCLNHMASLNRTDLQVALSPESISLSLCHVIARLISHQTQPHASGNPEILHEAILLAGEFTVNNANNQRRVHVGGTATILPLLCDLPFKYFSDDAHKEVLFPTLLASCYGSESNTEVLKRDLNCSLLVEYIEKKIQEQTKTTTPTPTTTTPHASVTNPNIDTANTDTANTDTENTPSSSSELPSISTISTTTSSSSTSSTSSASSTPTQHDQSNVNFATLAVPEPSSTSSSIAASSIKTTPTPTTSSSSTSSTSSSSSSSSSSTSRFDCVHRFPTTLLAPAAEFFAQFVS